MNTSDFTNVRNPKFSDDTGYRVDIIADINGVGADLPFTAAFNDPETYGREVYEMAVNGMFGEVEPFVNPALEIEYRKNQARNFRDWFISNTDKLTIIDYTIDNIYLSEEQRKELFDVRLAFKKWPESKGWPDVSYPTIPEWIIQDLDRKGFIIKNMQGISK